jgi:hypothetical protein
MYTNVQNCSSGEQLRYSTSIFLILYFTADRSRTHIDFARLLHNLHVPTLYAGPNFHFLSPLNTLRKQICIQHRPQHHLYPIPHFTLYLYADPRLVFIISASFLSQRAVTLCGENLTSAAENTLQILSESYGSLEKRAQPLFTADSSVLE